jgi:hypothetical protein
MDAQLRFEITNQLINRIDTFKPVADSKNYLTAHFDFLTDEWTNTVTVIFTRGDESYSVLLDSDNNCLVPWELIEEGGDIYVSCFCDDLITTSTSRIFIADSGYIEETENSEPPTPNIYDQLTGQFNQLKEDLLILDDGTFSDW